MFDDFENSYEGYNEWSNAVVFDDDDFFAQFEDYDPFWDQTEPISFKEY